MKLRFAFTLVELLVVVAIMGLMGAAAVGGYRAMKDGMEQRSVVENVRQFLNVADQRAQIDRQLVYVYAWNELLREESDFDIPIVVGRAVAVRRYSRITQVFSEGLVDEFADLRFSCLSPDSDEGNEDGKDESSVSLYRLKSSSGGKECSVVRRITTKRSTSVTRLVSGDGLTFSFTDNDYDEDADSEDEDTNKLYPYMFVFADNGQNGVDWCIGDTYGFEFAEIVLPNNYIFGSSVPSLSGTPGDVTELSPLAIRPRNVTGSGGGTSAGLSLTVSALKPESGSGRLVPKSIENVQL